MPKLLISDASEEYVYEIFDDEVTIGRGAANSVQVADTHASKHHCVFRRIRDHWKFVDLESSNGTRINGAFQNQAWLFDGDEISIGTSVMRYAAEGGLEGPPEVAAAKPRAVSDGVAVAPRAVPAPPARPVAAPARPAVARPAPVEEVAPARQMLEEVVPAAAAGGAAAAPARRRAGAPARRPARDRGHDDDYYDEEDGGRPRREPRKNNSMWIGLGLGLGAIVFTWIIIMVFDQSMSHNREVLYNARKIAARGEFETAVAYAEKNGKENSIDFDVLTTGVQDWRNTLAAKGRLLRATEAEKYFKYEIVHKAYSESKSNSTRPVGALPDSEVIPRIRNFLRQYWDTPAVHTFLASEHDVYPYFRELLRTNPDDKYTGGKALGEIRDEVNSYAVRREWGRAVKRLKRHAQLGRLSMMPEAFKMFNAQITNQISDYEERAAGELAKELQAVDALVDEGDRDLATQKIRVMTHRYMGIPSLLTQVQQIREKYRLRQ